MALARKREIQNPKSKIQTRTGKLVFRRARLSDRDEVLRICRNTWGGWDYVPLYFDRWVHEGGFHVIAEGKRLVGIGKITELAPGELWLEGLRIDPEQRSKGMGWEISRLVMKAALARKPVSLRLATGRRNRHSRKIIRRMGLRLKVSLWGREGPIPRKPGKPDVFIPDPQSAFDYIRRTEEYKAARHLLQNTWQFRTINVALMTELAAQKRIFACGSNEDIRGVMIVQPGRYESGRLDLSFIEGDRKALGEFHKQIRVFARAHKAKSISGMARGASAMRHLGGLRLRRWRRPGKLPHVMVYEYPLPAQRGKSKIQSPKFKSSSRPV